MMEWLTALLLGGVVGLDATSFPQAMYSRPFVAGALGGLVVGRPVEGALIGVLLEFFSLPILPFGAAGYPEGGTAAVASTVAYVWATDGFHPDMLFLAVSFGLVLSHVSGYSVRLLRIRNGRAVGQGDQAAPIEPRSVERGHLLAMGLDFLRGALVTAVGTALMAICLFAASHSGWALPLASINVLGVATLAMIGGSLTIFGTVRERLVSFVLGAAATAVAVWVL
ncbi:MAG TPA: PTS sugar transporter subunit IIC [Longimicrobiales bacterium]|nr:PTS sugar transporter subunit IIC [Longimicrobiales bacterium]